MQKAKKLSNLLVKNSTKLCFNIFFDFYTGIFLGPSAPTDVTVFNNQATQLFVRWNDYNTAVFFPVTSYRLSYWNAFEGPGVQYKFNTSRQIIISNLLTNSEYNIRVRCLTNNGSVTSQDSLISTGTTRE